MKRAGLVAAAIGALALVVAIALGAGARAMGAVAAGWMLCTGLAAGGVAASAAVRLSRGRWASQVLPIAEAGVALLVPAAIGLAIIVATGRWWMPRITTSAWIALAIRDLVAAAALAIVGQRYVHSASLRHAVAYLLLYVIALSMWMVDLVMDLAPWAPSTVLPPLYFMGALLGGFAWPTLVAAGRFESNTRHDLGKLLFAFAIFWGYLVWAAYLPTWYGNLPDETGQLLARWHGGWWPLSLFAIVAVFGFPFCFLFGEQNKRRARRLAFGAGGIVCGLAVTHLLMIVPTVAPNMDGTTALASAAAALFPGVAVALLPPQVAGRA
jgi:hypothetical protein